MRYVSRPSVVEAIQYGPEFREGLVREVAEFIAGRPLESEGEILEHVQPRAPWDPPELEHSTLEILAGKDGAQGWVPLPLGHWVVRMPGDLSDHWPVDHHYFAKKYVPEEEAT